MKRLCHFIAKSTGKPCRKQVQDGSLYCHWHQGQRLSCSRPVNNYFKPDTHTQMDRKTQKWCRCVLHVASKQTDKCLENVSTNAGQMLDGQPCYNPFSVCSAQIGTSSRQCGANYDYSKIPNQELMAYAKMNKIKVPSPYSKKALLKAIMEWKKNFSK